MFIRFEGEGAESTVECTKYRKSIEGSTDGGNRLVLYIDDRPACWILQDPKFWHRAYVMNSDGKTIETICAPRERQKAH